MAFYSQFVPVRGSPWLFILSPCQSVEVRGFLFSVRESPWPISELAKINLEPAKIILQAPIVFHETVFAITTVTIVLSF